MDFNEDEFVDAYLDWAFGIDTRDPWQIELLELQRLSVGAGLSDWRFSFEPLFCFSSNKVDLIGAISEPDRPRQALWAPAA